MYNRASKQFVELPFEAENYGRMESKGKGKGKGKGTKSYNPNLNQTLVRNPNLRKWIGLWKDMNTYLFSQSFQNK